MLILHFHHIIERARNGFDIFSDIAFLLTFYFKFCFVNWFIIVLLYLNNLIDMKTTRFQSNILSKKRKFWLNFWMIEFWYNDWSMKKVMIWWENGKFTKVTKKCYFFINEIFPLWCLTLCHRVAKTPPFISIAAVLHKFLQVDRLSWSQMSQDSRF